MNSNGNANNDNASNANGVAFGFCTARSDAVTAGRRRSSTYAEGELIPGANRNNPPVQTAGRCLHGRPMCAGLFHSRTATRVERAPDNHPLRRVPERARRRTIHDKRRAKRGPVSKTPRRAGSKTPARSEACGSFEQVFSYENLYKAGLACCKGVRWKCSTRGIWRVCLRTRPGRGRH